jgi:hypothetical protein
MPTPLERMATILRTLLREECVIRSDLIEIRAVLDDYEATGIPGEGKSSLRIGSPSRVPSNWRPIAEAPRDGTTVEVRGTMLVHYMQGAKFAIMPRDWRPETPQTEWHLTEWRVALPSPPPAAEDAKPSTERGEATPSPPSRPP